MMGSASEYLRRAAGGEPHAPSLMLSEQNVSRLVDKLSKMRGAALKFGQFMSIQDSHMLPPQLEQVLLRVQDCANYMPPWQFERVLTHELGPNWRSNFAHFDERPFAAASIGQVHSATLADPFPSQPELAGRRVAVKVQFPGVAESIAADLGNIKWLLVASALLPKGLFLENSLRVLQRELEEECDYTREAEMGRQFFELVKDYRPTGHLRFEAPRVVSALCTPRVLTTELLFGRPLTHATSLPQAQRNAIAHAILELSLCELFNWRLMQTDPNWTNFLYDAERSVIQLIDFGATRPYTQEFMDQWLCLLRAAISGDRDACIRWSESIGYLTGDESETMRDAHVASMCALGEPFRTDAPIPYPFEGQTITDRVRGQIPIMLRERLRPPPPETYSLNRKLSGAFLLCARLGADVNCRDMFADVTRNYKFSDGTSTPPALPPARTARVPSGVRGLHTARRPSRTRLLGGSWSYLTERSSNRSGLRKETQETQTVMDSTPSSINVRGITVPVRPQPPGPEDCCMSGCVNCVYVQYMDELEEYRREIKPVREKLLALDPPLTRDEWDSRLGPMPGSSDSGSGDGGDGGSGSDGKSNQPPDDGLDTSMRAFLDLERQLNAQKK